MVLNILVFDLDFRNWFLSLLETKKLVLSPKISFSFLNYKISLLFLRYLLGFVTKLQSHQYVMLIKNLVFLFWMNYM
jgi:hypothetical protein